MPRIHTVRTHAPTRTHPPYTQHSRSPSPASSDSSSSSSSYIPSAPSSPATSIGSPNSSTQAAHRRTPLDASSDNEPKPKPKNKSKSKSDIPRPPNSFILFRSDLAKQRTWAPHQSGSDMSVGAGAVWQRMTPLEKRPWVKRAAEEKKKHALMYPEYKYQPNRSPCKPTSKDEGAKVEKKTKPKKSTSCSSAARKAKDEAEVSYKSRSSGLRKSKARTHRPSPLKLEAAAPEAAQDQDQDREPVLLPTDTTSPAPNANPADPPLVGPTSPDEWPLSPRSLDYSLGGSDPASGSATDGVPENALGLSLGSGSSSCQSSTTPPTSALPSASFLFSPSYHSSIDPAYYDVLDPADYELLPRVRGLYPRGYGGLMEAVMQAGGSGGCVEMEGNGLTDEVMERREMEAEEGEVEEMWDDVNAGVEDYGMVWEAQEWGATR